MGYIKQKLRDVLGKIIGSTVKTWDMLWDIFVKSYGIYLTKMRGILGKTMGCIIGYNRQYFQIIGYSKEKTGRYISPKMGLRQ